MKNLFLITIFALVMSGATAQDNVTLNKNVTVQETEVGASIQLETTYNKSIDLLVGQFKARKDNNLTVSKRGKVESYLIAYEAGIYLVLDSEHKELMQSTRIADVKTYFKGILKKK